MEQGIIITPRVVKCLEALSSDDQRMMLQLLTNEMVMGVPCDFSEMDTHQRLVPYSHSNHHYD